MLTQVPVLNYYYFLLTFLVIIYLEFWLVFQKNKLAVVYFWRVFIRLYNH